MDSKVSEIEDSMNRMTVAEMGRSLGLAPRSAAALRSGELAFTPRTARVMAGICGDGEAGFRFPANIFLVTQVRTLRRKIRRGEITGAGIGRSAALIVQKLRNGFGLRELDETDKEYIQAREELNMIALSVFDLSDGSVGKG